MAGEARAMPSGPHLVEGSGGMEVGFRLYDAQGVVQWVSFFDRQNADGGKKIAVDGAGNVFITGSGGAPAGSGVASKSRFLRYVSRASRFATTGGLPGFGLRFGF